MVANVFAHIFAIRQRLNIQNQLSSINRSIARITKRITRTEQQLNSQKRAETTQVKQYYTNMYSSNTFMQMAMNDENGTYNSLFDKTTGGFKQDAWSQANASLWNQFQTSQQEFKAQGQQQMQYLLDQIEENYENEYQCIVESLKDEQADLEAEKESLTAQLEATKGMEEQEKQFAQSNLKSMFDSRA